MGFKFWLDPGAEECYHELLEKSSRLYFMYEILNVHTQDDSIIAYLRNTHNNSIITVTNTRQYGHLEFTTNETSKNTREYGAMFHLRLMLSFRYDQI